MVATQAFTGIRVLEVGGGVGVAFAAKLFADLGADVVRVENDADDVVARRPHDVGRWLNTNKRSVTGDPLRWVDGADIVLHDLKPSVAAARGLAYDALAARSPRLVVGAVTPFGSTGPYAQFAAEELTVIHASSWGFLSPSAATDIELAPLKAYGHHASITTATVAATALLAAHFKAEQTGRGDFVDFSTFAAGARMTETAPAAASFQGEDPSRLGTKAVVPWGIYACRDGLMQFLCVEQTQWEALVELMGNPEWAQMEVFATNADRRENSDLVNLYVAEWMAEQTIDDLYRDGQAARLCMSPVYTMEQLGRDPHFEARGFFATTPDGLRIPGSGFQSDQQWWALKASSPSRGQHDDEAWLARSEPAAAAVATAAPTGRPLDGIRICDFTWIWAGPYCTQLLAHLGADVIRLESPEHLCLFRRLPLNPPALPLTPDTNGLFQIYNSDKRSVAIDIAHGESRQVIERLVRSADVVIDNFAVGTMARLGYGVEDLRRLNPNVIVVSLSGYGQTGPSSDFMAYGPAGGAVAGLYAATGYEGGSAAETGVAIGDPCTGITAAWGVMTALAARQRSGVAARIDVAMVEAIAATVGEAWMAYLADGVPPGPGGNHDPSWAPHNCYAALGADTWVTIACTTDAEWQALASLIDPALARDSRFLTAANRKTNETELDALVGAWTATRDRWAVTAALQDLGIAAAPSLSPLELWSDDPQLDAIGMLERPEHPVTGDRIVPGVPWRLTNGANGLRRAAPTLGQHTEEVLTSVLGFTAAEVNQLGASGALPTLSH